MFQNKPKKSSKQEIHFSYEKLVLWCPRKTGMIVPIIFVFVIHQDFFYILHWLHVSSTRTYCDDISTLLDKHLFLKFHILIHYANSFLVPFVWHVLNTVSKLALLIVYSFLQTVSPDSLSAFLEWILHIETLGRDNQLVLLACVVQAINTQFPAPDGWCHVFKETTSA